MKNFPVIVLAIMILVACFAVYRYTEVMAPTWQVTAAQQAAVDLQQRQADAAIDAQEHAQRAADWTDAQRIFLWVIVLGVGGWIGVTAWAHYDKRQESRARAVDGTFALQTFKAAGQVFVTDPNKATFGVFGQDQRTGSLITDASIIGPDRQLAYATTVQRTRTAAASEGDGRFTSAKGRWLAGAYDKPVSHILYEQLEAPDDEPITPFQPLTLAQAFAQSQPDRWLLGQNDRGACEFNVQDNIHSGLLGATGTGKSSSTALLMAFNALRHGFHVIALDGKAGVDWAAYNKYLEAWPTDYTTIGDQVGEIVRLHDLRMKDIKRAGVANVYELDYQIPPMFVILEEFGYTMQALKAANKKQHDQAEGALSNLMRVSRSTGIYFLLIDQSAEHWPGVIKANVKAWFAYRLGGQQGNAFNAYNLHELKPKGQFWHNDNVYDAWFTKGEAKTLLQNLQPKRIKMLTDVQYSVVTDNGSTGASGAANRGVSTGQNTPHDSAPVQVVQSGATGEHHPVQEAVQGGASQSAPVLTGKPITAKDKATVLNIYAMTQSKNETMRLVWGSKNTQRAAWLNEILQGGEVQQ